MKTLTLSLVICLFFIHGYAQDHRSAAVSATIMGEIKSAEIGRRTINKDTVVTVSGLTDFCYSLVIDSVQYTESKKEVMINEKASLVGYRRLFLLNCN